MKKGKIKITELQEYKDFDLSKEDIEMFKIAMFLQHSKIPMPSITPTRFGLSVYKRIVERKVEDYFFNPTR